MKTLKQIWTQARAGTPRIDSAIPLMGIALGVLILYSIFIGFNLGLTVLWAGTLLASLSWLWKYRSQNERDATRLDAHDLETILLLIVLLAPIFFLFNYNFPFPVNSDEIHIMRAETEFLSRSDLHLLSVSPYFGFPTFIFVVYGAMGKMLGGITLGHMRTVAGGVGILITLGAYFMFRSFGSRLYALGGALVLGLNHVLLAYGRLAMRDTSGLLTGVFALGCLARAWIRECAFFSFLGGLLMGLGYYANFPGRITAPLWFAFLGGAWFWHRTGPERKIIRLLFIWSSLGFALTVAPLLVNSIQYGKEASRYGREQLMIFPEGRQLQKRWFGDTTLCQAWARNIRNGLFVLNHRSNDAGWIYPDSKTDYAYVDPVSGILVWIGVVLVLYRIRKSRGWTPDRWMVFGLFAMLLILAFVVNKAPNYSRVSMILPFTAFFVIEALQQLSLLLTKQAAACFSRLPLAVFSRVTFKLGVLFVALANLSIFAAVMERGYWHGNPLGAVVRYVDRSLNHAGYTYYVAADAARYPLFGGYTQEAWVSWVRDFAGGNNRVEWLDPSRLFFGPPLQRPCTIFMGEALWRDTRSYWLIRFPQHRMRSLDVANSALAVEIP